MPKGRRQKSQKNEQEKITVSNWLQYLEFVCTINSNSQMGYIAIIVSILIAIMAIMTVTQNTTISVSLLIIVAVYIFIFRREMGNKYFFKGKVAGKFAANIISRDYPELKNIDVIENCWDEFDHRTDKLTWNERRKMLIRDNIQDFNKWFDETTNQYQKKKK